MERRFFLVSRVPMVWLRKEVPMVWQGKEVPMFWLWLVLMPMKKTLKKLELMVENCSM